MSVEFKWLQKLHDQYFTRTSGTLRIRRFLHDQNLPGQSIGTVKKPWLLPRSNDSYGCMNHPISGSKPPLAATESPVFMRGWAYGIGSSLRSMVAVFLLWPTKFGICNPGQFHTKRRGANMLTLRALKNIINK